MTALPPMGALTEPWCDATDAAPTTGHPLTCTARRDHPERSHVAHGVSGQVLHSWPVTP